MGALMVVAGASEARSPMYDPYNNILNMSVNYGTTNTLFSPARVLRPYRGELFRISIPHSCGATTIGQMSLWGQSYDGRRVPVSAYANGPAEQGYGVNRFYYTLNGGRPVTLSEIGILVTTANPYGCQISFEQANQSGPAIDPVLPPQNECSQDYACPMHIDNTRSCTAYPNQFGLPSFEAYNDGNDNACTLGSDVKRQLCAQGYVPSQFRITCR